MKRSRFDRFVNGLRIGTLLGGGILALSFLALMVAIGHQAARDCRDEWERMPANVRMNRLRGLPDGAAEVEEVGRDWYAFTLEVGGQRRRFLFKRNEGTFGDADAIVELRPGEVVAEPRGKP